MGENTKITWTHSTFNPWLGCQRVSPGCEHCYAETLCTTRLGVKWGAGVDRKRTSVSNWKLPLRWNRKAAKEERRIKVFCASLADVFEDNNQLISWRMDLFNLIEQTPNLDWLLLTKRPENVMSMTPDWWNTGRGGKWPDNVWIGTTVENQQYANKRIPELMKIPARIHFLSAEPLLGPIDFRQVPGFNRIGFDLNGWWVIVGGESGTGARPMQEQWARDLRDQCVNAHVPFFFKQWGEHGGDQTQHHGGDLLDGRQWQEFPHA